MRVIATVIFVTLLTGCAGDQSQLLQALRLDECEIGSVDIQGEISTGFTVFSGKLMVNINEVHTADTLPAF